MTTNKNLERLIEQRRKLIEDFDPIYNAFKKERVRLTNAITQQRFRLNHKKG